MTKKMATCFRILVRVNILLYVFDTLPMINLGMDIDPTAVPALQMTGTASISTIDTGILTTPPTSSALANRVHTGITAFTSPANEQTQVNSLPSNYILQCSNAKKLGRTAEVYNCTGTDTGPQYTATTASVPRVGTMFNTNQTLKTFHGARMQKGNVQCNEVITSSFDPATLNCIMCQASHPILNKTAPTTLCFTDQNFPANISTMFGTGCVAIFRYEDATLSELASIALEVLDKQAIYPGSVLLFGSASHLFKVGTSCYAADWVQLLMKIETRLKSVNVCPLIPILLDNVPGSLVRDLEVFSTWLHKSYANNMKGFLECWEAVTHYAQVSSSGHTTLGDGEIQKILMPATLVTPLLVPHYFKFATSAPVLLSGMSSQVITEIIRILFTALQNNFSMAVGTEVRLPSVNTAGEDVKMIRHLVCIGSSIMKQLIPFLQASGYSVTDLSVPGWLASEENINLLIKKMSELQIDQPFNVVMDLFSNCSHRYRQFDGTQSLPYKEGGRYHMPGLVEVCADDTFRKIVKSLAPVLLSAQNVAKIILPPLPRYTFTPCCNQPTHCTNLSSDGYAEKSLNGVTKLRGILKSECAKMGVKNVWVLDGIGALLDTAPGESYGSNLDVLPELRGKLSKDWVHLDSTGTGNRNMAKTIIRAFDTLKESGPVNGSPVLGMKAGKDFFWRGFSSPNGDAVGRAGPRTNKAPPRKWAAKQTPYNRPARPGPGSGGH